MCIPCISRAHEIAIRAIGSGYLCERKITPVRMAKAIRAKKIIVRAHGFGYPCEKNYRLCAQLGLFVRKKIASVRTARASTFGCQVIQDFDLCKLDDL